MPTYTYDSAKVTVIVGGKLITGFGQDTFITIERDEDMWTKATGVDGHVTRAKTNNYGGKVSVNLLHSSPANSYFQSLVTADELSNSGVVPFLMRDLSGTTVATALQMWVNKTPSVEFGKTVGERTWVFDSDNIQIAIGGNTV